MPIKQEVGQGIADVAPALLLLVLVLEVLGRKLVAAGGTRVVLLQPGKKALLVENVVARHFDDGSVVLLELVLADRAFRLHGLFVLPSRREQLVYAASR